MRCRYTPDGPFLPEFYEGVINTIGFDLGKSVGASGSATAGVGVGANVLFGGSGRSFALQPLSLQGQVGLDLTLGVSGLAALFRLRAMVSSSALVSDVVAGSRSCSKGLRYQPAAR